MKQILNASTMERRNAARRLAGLAPGTEAKSEEQPVVEMKETKQARRATQPAVAAA